MKRLISFGLLVFILCALAFAPASLFNYAIPTASPLQLLQPSGTIWRGKGSIRWHEAAVGQLNWRVHPWKLLVLKLGGAVQWSDISPQNSASAINNTLYASFGGLHLQSSGTLLPSTVNRILAPYDMTISGALNLDMVELEVTHDGKFQELNGQLQWDGGAVSYVLNGQYFNRVMDPMKGTLEISDGKPTLNVYPENGKILLLQLSLMDNGFIKVGMTRYMTRLLGTPWPGSEPDHAIVLEVEQQLF